jgi:hypothetical protein
MLQCHLLTELALLGGEDLSFEINWQFHHDDLNGEATQRVRCPRSRRSEMVGGLEITQAQYQPRRDRQCRRDMEQFERVGQDLVLLRHFRWPVMCPDLDQDRQILIGAVHLDADTIVECYPSGPEDCDPFEPIPHVTFPN